MKETTVSARWAGEGMDFVGSDGYGHELTMGGKNVRPRQLLLLAMAGCMGMDVIHVMKKKRQDVTDIEVKVTGHQPDDYPKPYQIVDIEFTFKGNDLNPKAVQRAIDLSRETYCIVGQTLRTNVTLKTSYTIEDQAED